MGEFINVIEQFFPKPRDPRPLFQHPYRVPFPNNASQRVSRLTGVDPQNEAVQPSMPASRVESVEWVYEYIYIRINI